MSTIRVQPDDVSSRAKHALAGLQDHPLGTDAAVIGRIASEPLRT